MQHVHGHAENIGIVCTDHAAALGAFGLVSNDNFATRGTHHSFDSLHALLLVSNLEKFWKSYVKLGRSMFQLLDVRP